MSKPLSAVVRSQLFDLATAKQLNPDAMAPNDQAMSVVVASFDKPLEEEPSNRELIDAVVPAIHYYQGMLSQEKMPAAFERKTVEGLVANTTAFLLARQKLLASAEPTDATETAKETESTGEISREASRIYG